MPNRRHAAVTLTAIRTMSKGDILHDTTLKGFGARCQGEAISYFLKCRVDGKQRWFTIGRHGHPWTPDSARKHALKLLANPTLDDKPEPTEARLFAQTADDFITVHGPKLKASTCNDYARIIALHIKPTFATKPIATITRADVSTWHAKLSSKPRVANYALAVLSKIMTWAEDQGYRPDNSNPARRVQRYKEVKREHFLQADELARLGTALDTTEAQHLASPYAIAAMRLLVFTGARLNEVLTLQWSFVDFERRMLFLPDSKTGQKSIPLNDPAIDVLKAVPRFATNPYVFVGRHGKHLVNLAKPWNVVRQLAGMPALRMHDLRHTYASAAVAAGGSLPILGKALGHTQPSTTQRYAHLNEAPVRKLAEAAGKRLAKSLNSKPQ